MIGTLQQIFMVSAVWSLLVTLFAGIAFIIMKDKYQLRNKKDKEEKKKRKKMVKITRIIFFSVAILTVVLALTAIVLKIILNLM